MTTETSRRPGHTSKSERGTGRCWPRRSNVPRVSPVPVARVLITAVGIGVAAAAVRILRGPEAPAFRAPALPAQGVLTPPTTIDTSESVSTPPAAVDPAAADSATERNRPAHAETAIAAGADSSVRGHEPRPQSPTDSTDPVSSTPTEVTQLEHSPATTGAQAHDAAAPAPPGERWVFPNADGTCPPDHRIKAKLRSGLFHEPGMAAYERTNPDRCYSRAIDAESDGLRRAKR